MAITTSFGYTDKVTTPKNIAIPDLSYSSDFAVTRETPDEVILTNRTSPIDQPETLRFGYQTISNVYSNTGIDPSYMSVTRRGINLLAQVNDIFRISGDLGDANMSIIDLPISAHIVLKTPLSQYITAQVCLQVIDRARASLCDTGSTGESRLEAMLRHALTPPGL